MRKTQIILKSIFLCSLLVLMLDIKSSHAAPSFWFFKANRHSIYPNSPRIRSLKRTRRSTNEEESTRASIEPRIRDLPWYEELERPCFPGETHLNPHNNFSWVMTDHLRDQDVLSIAGEEANARTYFSRVESRLSHLSQVQLKPIYIEDNFTNLRCVNVI